MTLDLASCYRDSIVDNSGIADLLSQWNGEPAVHTRQPVPQDTARPFIIISAELGLSDFDALNKSRPISIRNIIVYGEQPDEYRVVEEIGYKLRELFHRNRFATVPNGYSVVDIQVQGPFPAPVDDEKEVARAIRVTTRLREI